EHHEGGLEGVLGVRGVAQDTPADAEDHRPVAAEELLERPLVAARDEAFQQLGVGDLTSLVRAREVAEVTDGALKLTRRHGSPRCGERPVPTSLLPRGRRFATRLFARACSGPEAQAKAPPKETEVGLVPVTSAAFDLCVVPGGRRWRKARSSWMGF